MNERELDSETNHTVAENNPTELKIERWRSHIQRAGVLLGFASAKRVKGGRRLTDSS